MEIRSAEGAVGTEIARTESKNAAARVFLGELRDGYPSCIRQGCEFTGVTKNLKWGDHVVVKPNLTFPVYRKGVMTNPDAVKAVVEHFRDFTNRITICESDSGGYNRFSMDEVFRVTGIADMANRYGISVTNLTNCAARPITISAS